MKKSRTFTLAERGYQIGIVTLTDEDCYTRSLDKIDANSEDIRTKYLKDKFPGSSKWSEKSWIKELTLLDECGVEAEEMITTTFFS